MMDLNYKSNVVLPEWCFAQANDKEEIKQLVLEYMNKNYPDYQVKQIKNGMAVCIRK